MKIESIIRAELNVEITKGIILSFLNGIEKNCSYDLLLVSTAFIYSKECRDLLKYANKSSNINTMFVTKKIFNNDIQSMVLWGNVSDRVDTIKNVFNEALIDLYNCKLIRFDKMINCNKKFDYNECDNSVIKSYFRASFYLGVIFKKDNNSDAIDAVLRRI